jgi:uncharacterized protein YkwD
LLCVFAVTAAGAAPGKHARQVPLTCPSAQHGKGVAVTTQVYCWIDAERARRGLAPLRRDRRLAKAAVRHSTRMERANVFSHSIGGGIFPRIKASGYLRGAKSFAVAETMAWILPGAGAKAATDQWLASAYHRSVLLSANFRDVGVGVVKGSPLRRREGGYTVTADFGRR